MLTGSSVWNILSKQQRFTSHSIHGKNIFPECVIGLEKSHCECVNVCLQVVGLYRLCGSAAVKKELREAFERDSQAVELCENMYPDVNVITGNTKVHYFFTKCLSATLSSVHKQPSMTGASLGYYVTGRVHKNIELPMTVSEQVVPNKSLNERLQLVIVFSINQIVQK